MKKRIPLLNGILCGLFLLVVYNNTQAQSITRVDGQPLTAPICLNKDYVLQIIPTSDYNSCPSGQTLTYVWEKDSGVGEVTFSPAQGPPNWIIARFSSAAGMALRVKLMCGTANIVTYFGGGITTGIPAPTVSSTNVSRCGSGSVTLQATPSSGNTIRWYSASGTLLSTSNTYSPTVSSNTTYFVSSYNASGTCTKESDRIPVQVTINPIPSLPTAPNVTRCGPGAVTLTGTAGTNGTTCNWYSSTESSGSITLLQSQTTSFTTPSVSATTLYNVTSINASTGCESGYRKVSAIVTTVTAPTSPNNPQRCGPGSITYSATPGSGAVIRWYPDVTSTFVLYTGSSFPANLSTTTTVYAANYYSAGGCVSNRIPVTATINPIPNAPADVDYEGSPCDAGTIVTVVPGTNANTCRWYSSTSAPTPFHTGTTYTLPSVTTYYVSSYNTVTGCESTSRAAVGCSGGSFGRKGEDLASSINPGESVYNDQWSVYPNPSASGSISIEISEEHVGKEIVLHIINGEGKEDVRHAFTDRERTFKTSLPAGLYMIRLTGKNFRHVKKVVVL